MSSDQAEFKVENFYKSNKKIKKICLLKADGTFSIFLSNNNIDEGEKKRLAASIMASIVLAERSVINLVQEKVKQVVINSEQDITFIFMTKQNNYLYILAEKDFDSNLISKIELDF